MDLSLLLNVSYEFFSLLSWFTPASSLASVAVASVFFRPSGASKKVARGKKGAKKKRKERGGGGGG